jgi:hypothetical protein
MMSTKHGRLTGIFLLRGEILHCTLHHCGQIAIEIRDPHCMMFSVQAATSVAVWGTVVAPMQEYIT